jgi:lipid-binding SYLF domain-containing protein
MKTVSICFAALLLAASAASLQAAEVRDYSGDIKVFQQTPYVKPYFSSAYGYALFPTIGKGGVGIGGAYGRGQVYRRGKVTGIAQMFQASIGWQLGGQAYSQIIFFQDKRAYDEFTNGSFEFDATASAVAITAGAQAQAGTKGATAGASAGPRTGTQTGAGYNKGMAVFIHAKGGLMYEAALAGQKFSFEPTGGKK